MIRRQILDDLRRWKERSDHHPLILRGARQVGKTTIVREFGRDFDVFLSLNLEKRDDAALFEQCDGARELLDEIFMHLGLEKPTSGSVLLFIDEIQCSPRAVASLRYFYEEMPALHVIAAGSLLENLIDTHVAFPVGRVEYMALRPCSFLEFLNGLGEESDAQVIRNRRVRSIHGRLMRRFRQYMILGGMPAIISKYAENHDILAVNYLYEALLTSYRDDAQKYAKNETQRQLLAHILTAGWAEAAETITLDGFAGSAYKAREVGEAMHTLERAMLLEMVYPTVEPRVPLLPNMRRKPKLIWIDTGLANYQAQVRKALIDTRNIMDMWRGRAAEQIVAQELIAIQNNVGARRYFWARDKKDSAAEVDFVVQHDMMTIPIEVKSGHNSRLRSLHSFMDLTPHHIAVRIWDLPLSSDTITTPRGKTFTLINLPFYYISQLHEIINTLPT